MMVMVGGPKGYSPVSASQRRRAEVEQTSGVGCQTTGAVSDGEAPERQKAKIPTADAKLPPLKESRERAASLRQEVSSQAVEEWESWTTKTTPKTERPMRSPHTKKKKKEYVDCGAYNGRFTRMKSRYGIHGTHACQSRGEGGSTTTLSRVEQTYDRQFPQPADWCGPRIGLSPSGLILQVWPRARSLVGSTLPWAEVSRE